MGFWLSQWGDPKGQLRPYPYDVSADTLLLYDGSNLHFVVGRNIVKTYATPGFTSAPTILANDKLIAAIGDNGVFYIDRSSGQTGFLNLYLAIGQSSLLHGYNIFTVTSNITDSLKKNVARIYKADGNFNQEISETLLLYGFPIQILGNSIYAVGYDGNCTALYKLLECDAIGCTPVNTKIACLVSNQTTGQYITTDGNDLYISVTGDPNDPGNGVYKYNPTSGLSKIANILPAFRPIIADTGHIVTWEGGVLTIIFGSNVYREAIGEYSLVDMGVYGRSAYLLLADWGTQTLKLILYDIINKTKMGEVNIPDIDIWSTPRLFINNNQFIIVVGKLKSTTSSQPTSPSPQLMAVSTAGTKVYVFNAYLMKADEFVLNVPYVSASIAYTGATPLPPRWPSPYELCSQPTTDIVQSVFCMIYNAAYTYLRGVEFAIPILVWGAFVEKEMKLPIIGPILRKIAGLLKPD